ncbi:Cys-tRNA(Pro) deacylase [Aerococcus viridans]|uniref:Cys-tRNA(Pro) deacylase n=1 Tax=Aerococcus viridans TaxID=1377 RepID=UPI003AA7AC54
MAKAKKTNVIRKLDQLKIPYTEMTLPEDFKPRSSEDVAEILGINPDQQFKTLVTHGKSKDHYVFLVPVNHELDLKLAAAAVGEKNIHMITQKDLEPLTGYIHGGCSPIGMKKAFPTIIDASAQNYETIIFSAGKRGFLVEAPVNDLEKVITQLDFADILF